MDDATPPASLGPVGKQLVSQASKFIIKLPWLKLREKTTKSYTNV